MAETQSARNVNFGILKCKEYKLLETKRELGNGFAEFKQGKTKLHQIEEKKGIGIEPDLITAK